MLVAASVGMLGCDETDGFTADQWDQIEKMEPLKGDPPPNPFNNRSNDVVLSQFGQMLFFDKDVAEAIKVAGPSGNIGDIRKVACVTCHGTSYFIDARPGPISEGISYLTTNTGDMLNLAWYDWTLSTGRFDSLVEHGTTVWSTSATPLAQARFLYTKYLNEYNATFPDTPLDPRLGIPPTDPTSVYPATGGPKSSAERAGRPVREDASGRAEQHQPDSRQPGAGVRRLPATGC